jgi:hypothetical protein
VTAILSLAEHHASIYAADRAGLRTLYFQNGDGKVFGRLDLGREEREHWISVLEGAFG